MFFLFYRNYNTLVTCLNAQLSTQCILYHFWLRDGKTNSSRRPDIKRGCRGSSANWSNQTGTLSGKRTQKRQKSFIIIMRLIISKSTSEILISCYFVKQRRYFYFLLKNGLLTPVLFNEDFSKIVGILIRLLCGRFLLSSVGYDQYLVSFDWFVLCSGGFWLIYVTVTRI